MLVILPFEKEFYKNYQYEVEFVGHPLLDAINKPSVHPDRDSFYKANELTGKPVISLLPGSRKQEISRMLPVMASVAEKHPGFEFIIAGAPSLSEEFYHGIAGKGLKIISGQTYELLRISRAALVTSGTATLETALLEVPQVVCYKGSAISYAIARRIVDVKYISLVNLIMDKQVVTELIQSEFNADNLENELLRILEENNRCRIKADYQLLKEKLGGPGASERAAKAIGMMLQATSCKPQAASCKPQAASRKP